MFLNDLDVHLQLLGRRKKDRLKITDKESARCPAHINHYMLVEKGVMKKKKKEAKGKNTVIAAFSKSCNLNHMLISFL